LLKLEQVLPGLDVPARVFYCFSDLHEIRNVAAGNWLLALSRHSRRNHVYLPYATLDGDNSLIRHQSKPYAGWPLRQKLALVSLMEAAYMKISTFRRGNQKKNVTERIILQMQEICSDYGVEFTVVVLMANAGNLTHYTDFMSNNGIKMIDCVFPITDEMRVRGEGHPNADANTRWADCLEEYIE